MASTNKTTHYELSQYIGTDKPTYLGDYNSDMSNIDTGIYNAQSDATSALNASASASESASQAIGAVGTLSNLTTTEKSNLVGAINEVNSNTSTNGGKIGDLSNLSTVDKSSLVGATNEVNSVASSNGLKIGTLSNLDTTDKSSLVNAINEIFEKTTVFGKLVERNSYNAPADQSVAGNTETVVLYPNEHYNQFSSNEITYSNGIFTVNTDKISHVLINTQIFIRNGQAITGYIKKNNETVFTFSTTEIETRIEGTFLIPVEENDTFNVSVYLANNGALRNDLNNMIQIVTF